MPLRTGITTSQSGLLRGNNAAQRACFKLAAVRAVRAKIPGATCGICAKENHTATFCPAAATQVPKPKQIAFIENLLTMPREDISVYEGLPPEEVMRRVTARAESLNAGNPFRQSIETRDLLRARAGFWKAIGTDNVVLSWICYGYDVR